MSFFESEVYPRLLLVDDDETVLQVLQRSFASRGFAVATACNAKEALSLIASQPFDALISDLHMPERGDGLTVVTAMRHSNPKAVTLIYSAFPELNSAAEAIILQADEVLVKPLKVDTLIERVTLRLQQGTPPARSIVTLAQHLETDAEATVQDWLRRLHQTPEINAVPLHADERGGHLPQIFREMVGRLGNQAALGSRISPTRPASEHGELRCHQGYTAAMIAEEFRLLQVSIFHSVQNNLSHIDFSTLLHGVMSIANELNTHLAQAIHGHTMRSESLAIAGPA